MNKKVIIQNQDKKQINKLIRKISNTSSLPVLVYFILYVFLLYYALPQAFKLVRRSGIILADNTKDFIQYLVIYLLIIPVSIFIFQKVRGNKAGLKIRACYKRPEKSAGWIFKWVLIGWSLTVIALHKESFKLMKGELSVSKLKKILIYFTSPVTVIYILL